MSTPTIRAALERLVEIDDANSINGADPDTTAWTDAIAFACAALEAEPVGEGPPAVMTSALLHPAYEPGDGSADGAQMVGMAWWHPVMGCDSLQIVADNARDILRSRWARPAAPLAPEVGELVAQLGEDGKHLIAVGYANESVETRDLGIRVTRAAALLQQQESRIATLRSALAHCGRAAGSAIGADCSDAFLLEVPQEVRLAVAKAAPVAVAVIERLADDALTWLSAHAIPLPQAAELEGANA
jgi:hypothetical protein